MMGRLRALLPWSGAIALGVWLSVAFAGVALLREARGRPVPFLDDVEDALLDLKFQARGVKRPGGDVIVAAVDERSLKRFGRWPWSREAFAALVDRLRVYGAKTVVFDVVFDEPERATPAAGGGDPDGRFAEAIRRAGNVVLGYFLFRTPGEAPGVPPEDLLAGLDLVESAAARAVATPERPDAPFESYAGVRAPVEPLARAAGKWMGYFNTAPRTGARVAGFQLASEVNGRILYHLSVAAVAHFLGFDPVVRFREHGPPDVILEDRVVPAEVHGRFYPSFYGPRNTFKHFSVADIVDGVVPPERLRGKLVFVGATALALYDTWRSPFDPALPGVEIHATAADNILSRRFLSRPLWLSVAELGVLLFLGPILAYAVSRARLALGLAAAVLLLGVTWLGDFLAFREGLLVRSALFYGEIAVVVLSAYVLLYFRVYKDRKRLRNTMGHYLAPTVLEEVLRDQSKLQLGGEKRELTVLFSDIRGFTALAEAIDARDLVTLLNEYFTPMTDVVLRHLGTFDKYMGDALMAFFGAPKRMPDHALRACRAAADMRDELSRLNAGWHKRGLPQVQIGIGLNTGPMAFGNMGSRRLFNYTVVGDHVNLAARIEGTSKLFGATIVVSESTARAAGGEFLFRRLGAVWVAGKSEPVEVWELVARASEEAALAPWLAAFREGLALFEARDLDGAEAAFRRASALRPDPAAEAYLARIGEVREAPAWEVAWRAGK